MRAVRIVVVFCLVLTSVLVAPLVRPTEAFAAVTTWWVDIAHGDNSNSGSSASPLRNISAAIARVHAGDTIMVRPGTYGSEFAQSFPIEIPPGVALKSSGGAYATTIESNGSQRVLSIHDATVGTTVSGFTITGGVGDGAGAMVTRDAAGVVDGWPLIEKCVFTGNGSAAVTGVPSTSTGATADSYAPASSTQRSGATPPTRMPCIAASSRTSISSGVWWRTTRARALG